MITPPLPPLRPVVIAPPAIKLVALEPTTDELLAQMVVVLFYGESNAYQARRRGCKDYGASATTARQAMLNALKVPL